LLSSTIPDPSRKKQIMKQYATAAAVSAAIAVALTGCAGGAGASSAGGNGASAAPSGSASSAPSSRSDAYGDMGAAAAGAAGPLHTVSTKLGAVLAAGSRTLYVFAADVPNSGRSACTGSCLTYWPPVLVPAVPKASGVAGKLGTIPAAGGKRQLTIDGRPLYTYVGDSATGDTNGQGLNLSGGLWWVVSPAGKAVTTR
jgi:predicted lipoprotein with Yx(FWY)xxD motif